MTTTHYYDNTGNRISRATYLRLQAQGIYGIHRIMVRRNQIILRIRPQPLPQPNENNNEEENIVELEHSNENQEESINVKVCKI